MILGRSVPRTTALAVLVRASKAGRPSSELLAASLSRHALAPRDRDLARELVQGVWRLRGSLDALLAVCSKRALDDLDPHVVWALRLGAYQIVSLDRVPTRAAVHATVEALKTTRSAHAAGFVNAVLRKASTLTLDVVDEAAAPDPCRSLPRGDGRVVILGQPVFPAPEQGEAAHLAARWSHPGWLVERWLADLGRDGTLQVLAAGLARPWLSLRPAADARERLEAALTERGVEFEREGTCLVLPSAGRVEELPGFAEGWFFVQGPTAASVVPALAPAQGDGVLDLCAAPGGKTLALAAAVGEKGAVFAADSSETRIERLRAEITRRGVRNVAAVVADATDPESLPKGLASRSTEGFDGVLVDVPCSNTGVLGRRVEARWRLEGPERVIMLAEQAAHLLLVAAGKVRVGGRVAYSTCSIEPEENSRVVRGFLAEDPDFELVSEQAALPAGGRRDGGYHAILTRRR